MEHSFISIGMTLIRKSPCLLDLFCAMFFLTFGNLTLDYSLWMTAFSMNTLWLALHRHIRGQGRYVWVAAPVWCWPFPGEWVWDLRKHLPKETKSKIERQVYSMTRFLDKKILRCNHDQKVTRHDSAFHVLHMLDISQLTYYTYMYPIASM